MSDVQTAEQLWVKAHELVKAGQLAHAVRDLARCYEILKAAQDPRLSQVHRRWIEVHQVYLRRSQKAKRAKESGAQANPDFSAKETGPARHEAAQSLAEIESATASSDSVAVATDAQMAAEPAHIPDSQSAVPEVVQESESSSASPNLYAGAVAEPESASSDSASISSHVAAEERSWAEEEPESDEIAVAGAGDFGEETMSEPEFDFDSEHDDDSGLAIGAAAMAIAGGASSEAPESSYSQAIAEEVDVVEEAAAYAWVNDGTEVDPSSSAAMQYDFSEPTAVDDQTADFARASVAISAESDAMPVGGAAGDDGEISTASALETNVDDGEASQEPIDIVPSQRVPATDAVASYGARLETPVPSAVTQESSFPLQSAGTDLEAFPAEDEASALSIAPEKDDVAFLEALLYRVESRRRHVGVGS